MQPPGVGFLLAGGMRRVRAVFVVPGDFVQVAASAAGGGQFLAVGQGVRVAGAAGVLPFGFGWQAETGSEFGAERLTVVPRHAFHRPVAGDILGVRRVAAHCRQPLALGDFAPSQVETAGQGHPVLGFVAAAAGLGGRAARGEGARRDVDHLHAGGLMDDGLGPAGLGVGLRRRAGDGPEALRHTQPVRLDDRRLGLGRLRHRQGILPVRPGRHDQPGTCHHQGCREGTAGRLHATTSCGLVEPRPCPARHVNRHHHSASRRRRKPGAGGCRRRRPRDGRPASE
ncbi:MAG: hypothetical protein BWZ02_02869 [Lentisphaerae bacterium ADurb.BinA184]|nr:MAG: hypothetical protein BWZ02_02869 [Lentisphaerae bacterium ADurb.BinA184]